MTLAREISTFMTMSSGGFPHCYAKSEGQSSTIRARIFSELCRGVPLLQACGEPGAGVSPVLIGACARDPEDLGGLLDREAREEAELDELGRVRLLPGQDAQGLIEVEQLVRLGSADHVGVIEVDPGSAAAVPLGLLA